MVGTVPKDYLAYGAPRLTGDSRDRDRLSVVSSGHIAKKGRFQADARECVTEEIISKIGSMLPVRMARSRLVRVAKDDVRFLSRDFVDVEHERHAQRSRPILSVGGAATQDHFGLVAGLAKDHPALFPAMRTVFDAVSIPAIEHMLQRRFRRIITQRRLRFIVELLEFRIGVLRQEKRP